MTPRTMSEQAFYILTALIDEPRHGYGIVGEVAALSENRLRLRVGTLVLQLATIAALATFAPPKTIHIGRSLLALATTAVLAFTVRWALILPITGVAGVLTLLAAPALASRELRPTWFATAAVTLVVCVLSLSTLMEVHVGFYPGGWANGSPT
ncbi:MAG: hypothetical protein ACRDNK_02975 [Solirubrobacteraceae bacterium]